VQRVRLAARSRRSQLVQEASSQLSGRKHDELRATTCQEPTLNEYDASARGVTGAPLLQYVSQSPVP
jgi:hypothetical protein